jgi:hypothetical protein
LPFLRKLSIGPLIVSKQGTRYGDSARPEQTSRAAKLAQWLFAPQQFREA